MPRALLASAVLAGAVALVGTAPARAVLVFERPATHEIAVAADDGSGQRVVARGRYPAVSPDGRRIAFLASKRGPATGTIRVVGTRGGPPQTILRRGLAPHGRAASWSASSRHLVAGGPEAVGARLVRVGRRLVTRRIRLPRGSTFAGATFSPDGARVLVGHGDLRTFTTLVDVRTGRRRVLGFWAGALWGRPGIARVRTDETRYDPGTYSAITVQRSPRGRAREILRTGPTLRDPVAWAADGRTLLVADTASPEATRALLVDAATGTTLTLPAPFDAVAGVSRDGQLVLGEMGGNVVTQARDGRVTVLAQGAASPTWTR